MKDIFDRKLAEKINEELSAYREPFQQDDWVRMQGRMEMHRASLGFWLARACALLLFLTSVSAYFLYEQPFSLLTSKPYGLLIEKNPLQKIDPISSLSPQIAYSSEWGPRFADLIPHANFALKANKSGKETSTYDSFDQPPPNDSVSARLNSGYSPGNLSYLNFIPEPQKEQTNETPDEVVGETTAANLSELRIAQKQVVRLDNEGFHLPIMDTRYRLYYAPISPKPKRWVHWENVSATLQAQHYFDSELSMSESSPGAGVLTGFRFGKAVQLQTGLQFAVQSTQSVANATERNRNGYVETKLRATQAIFHTFDLPINIQFDIAKRSRRSRYSIGLGISNFFLLKESYTKQDFEQSVSARSVSPETNLVNYYGRSLSEISWANSFNISVGIEKRLSQKSTLTFEPFVQLPLKKTGVQSVSFRNAGIRLRANFWNSRQSF